MEPLHMTEFASQRYFSKLNQLHEQQEGNAVEGPSAPVSPPLQQSSQFILPIRESKTDDADENIIKPQEPRKKGLFSFRSLRHSQSTAAVISSGAAGYQPQVRRPSTIESAKPNSVPFDHLFSHLPNELQIQIIASLPLADILSLRTASRSWHTLISLNEAPIVRYHLDHHIPAYATRLYPPPEPSALNFHYLCSLWHRLHVAAKLSYLITEWITKELFLRTTEAQKLEFAPQRERMRRRLIPLLFTIFHFFETYRDLHIKYLAEHNGRGLQQTPYTLNPIEVAIMNMYDDKTLLSVHQVFPLVVSAFLRRLRPPSYVGRVERSLRGYLREKPPDEVHVATLCIGGLRQVERFWEIKGYNTRRVAVDIWYSSITPEPAAEPQAKQRRGLMGLGRRRSASGKDDVTTRRSSFNGEALNNNTRASMDSAATTTASMRRMSGLVFNTSLSDGMPMGDLPRDDLYSLVPDLPMLQRLWLTTAEALILERKIVERPADIKRNAQVMLELIKEDNIAEEDEWWYGRGAPESVRPPMEAIEEDPIEAI